MKKIYLYCLISLATLQMPTAFAYATLGNISDQLMGPLASLANIIYAIAYVSGISFIIGGLVQYLYHRQNPQNVRLSAPITLWLVGSALIALPLLAMNSNFNPFQNM